MYSGTMQPPTSHAPLWLRAVRRAVSPQVFDFWAGQINPLWTLDQPLARIVARRDASADAATLVLRPNGHWHGMRAGQHVTVGVELDGRRLLRSYSPTPRPDGTLEITVRRVAGGRVSQHLVVGARVGDVVTLGQAFGDMALPAEGGVLLLAAGSGVTPIRALLSAWSAQQRTQPVTLLYWSRTRDSVCFADELGAWSQAHPAFDLRYLVTGEGAPRIDAMAGSLAALAAGRHVLACGPAGFVETARRTATPHAATFQAEAFTLPTATEATGEVDVRLARSGRTLRVPRGQALLPSLEAHGVRPAHGCRMGICNTCACDRAAGTTVDLLTGQLADEPSSKVRLCVSAARTDLVLDL
jgi:stearoyl-CoA 9-desaturase NADPH oxidoreductase